MKPHKDSKNFSANRSKRQLKYPTVSKRLKLQKQERALRIKALQLMRTVMAMQ